MFATLREWLTARKALFATGYSDAGRAVDVIDATVRQYLAFDVNRSHMECLGNILAGTPADVDGAFSAAHSNNVPVCWTHRAYMRGYHQRLVDHFATAFVQLELDTSDDVLPRGRIKLTVKGIGLGKPEGDGKVVRFPVRRV